MKRIAVRLLAFALLAAVFTTGCANSGGKKALTPQSKLKIGFSILTTDGFYVKKYIDVYNAEIQKRGYTPSCSTASSTP